MTKKALVSGGLGYIGSHTIVELQKRGFAAVIIDNLANSGKFFREKVECITNISPKFYKVDMCDGKGLKEVFKTGGVSDVIRIFGSLQICW